MRKLLIIVFILIVTTSILWVFDGRQLSMLIDRFKTIETSTQQIKSISYEGTGTGGVLHVGDVALSLNETQSAMSWPNFFDFNFMTGKSPTWKRHVYQKLTWTKPSGAKLEMLWRYEQYFYSDQGWLGGAMIREGTTGLIRIDISKATR